MKLALPKDSLSLKTYVFIEATASGVATGSGLTGLAYNTGSLTASYIRGGGARVAISLATQTVTGAYSSGGFVEVDATNMPGLYRFDIPDACVATGTDSARTCVIMLKGAANMAPCNLEIQIGSIPADLQEVKGTTQSAGDLVGLIGAIGSGTGAAMNFAATGDNTGGAIHGATFVGAQAGGTTYTNTAGEDLVYHQLTSTANVIDIVYNYNVGAGRTGTKATFKGYIVSSNDTFDVQAWDYVNSVWETRGYIVGQTGTTNVTKDFALLSRNTGTSTDAGDVHIRLKGRAGNSSPSIFLDELLVTGSNIGQTVGYSNGSIWVSATGTAGTTPYVNGTGDNPCPWANALTISSTLGIKRFEIAPATTITLSAPASGMSLAGKGWKLDLGGQDISYGTITGCEWVSGTATSTAWESFFWNCQMSTCRLGEADLHTCHITDVITLGAAAPYLFHNCVGVPIGTPGIDYDASGASHVVCGNWSGNCTITNMGVGDTLIFNGTAQLTLAASCTGGTVYIGGP